MNRPFKRDRGSSSLWDKTVGAEPERSTYGGLAKRKSLRETDPQQDHHPSGLRERGRGLAKNCLPIYREKNGSNYFDQEAGPFGGYSSRPQPIPSFGPAYTGLIGQVLGNQTTSSFSSFNQGGASSNLFGVPQTRDGFLSADPANFKTPFRQGSFYKPIQPWEVRSKSLLEESPLKSDSKNSPEVKDKSQEVEGLMGSNLQGTLRRLSSRNLFDLNNMELLYNSESSKARDESCPTYESYKQELQKRYDDEKEKIQKASSFIDPSTANNKPTPTSNNFFGSNPNPSFKAEPSPSLITEGPFSSRAYDRQSIWERPPKKPSINIVRYVREGNRIVDTLGRTEPTSFRDKQEVKKMRNNFEEIALQTDRERKLAEQGSDCKKPIYGLTVNYNGDYLKKVEVNVIEKDALIDTYLPSWVKHCKIDYFINNNLIEPTDDLATIQARLSYPENIHLCSSLVLNLMVHHPGDTSPSPLPSELFEKASKPPKSKKTSENEISSGISTLTSPNPFVSTYPPLSILSPNTTIDRLIIYIQSPTQAKLNSSTSTSPSSPPSFRSFTLEGRILLHQDLMTTLRFNKSCKVVSEASSPHSLSPPFSVSPWDVNLVVKKEASFRGKQKEESGSLDELLEAVRTAGQMSNSK